MQGKIKNIEDTMTNSTWGPGSTGTFLSFFLLPTRCFLSFLFGGTAETNSSTSADDASLIRIFRRFLSPSPLPFSSSIRRSVVLVVVMVSIMLVIHIITVLFAQFLRNISIQITIHILIAMTIFIGVFLTQMPLTVRCFSYLQAGWSYYEDPVPALFFSFFLFFTFCSSLFRLQGPDLYNIRCSFPRSLFPHSYSSAKDFV